ncbi:V-type immunoglobulin domain-containing suppressor of T-cell activation [Cololabis saira]|uniref:V-type immunoglobulin domain-containing suppressor of T-cell activation n=1 Tax=Cololabis saira TaxID=129043 RepID=UPI002AD31669|nr:V-type immunoglobulin domain-containing suppressor of T-cell activation [Cololabis saira]XP_061601343.1 V-type immunoglobulin domain-containing suppressor of T-cell activation [Cololabis saira]
MERRLPALISVSGRKLMFWIFSVLLPVTAAIETSHSHSTLGVSAPHLFYTCPEGATVQLMCTQRGAALHPDDVLKHGWLFTPHSDRRCTPGTGPRNMNIGTFHINRTLPAGLTLGYTNEKMWVILQNVTHADQGRYCCMILDFKRDHNHASLEQRSHSHLVLHVTPRRTGQENCTVWDPTPPAGSVPVALALAACILALLSLPLILVLVYKQRQNAQSNRRAQELVRMDSEAPGHENPVFLGGSPQIKTRTVSQIMTRQSSETGRRLLSDPGTPLSPPAHGDVFFPSEDTIPESPDLILI